VVGPSVVGTSVVAASVVLRDGVASILDASLHVTPELVGFNGAQIPWASHVSTGVILTGGGGAGVSVEVASHGVRAARPATAACLEVFAQVSPVYPVGLVELPGAADASPGFIVTGRIPHHTPIVGLTHAAQAVIGELGAGCSYKE